MLLDLRVLAADLVVPIRGACHIGAHYGDEKKTYHELGIKDVVWFEADPQTFQILKGNVSPYGHLTYNVLLADEEKNYRFNVTSNRGASSSLLRLKKHAQHHPHVVVTSFKELPGRRFDSFAQEIGLDLSKYNLLNIDVQGAELHVIKGMGDLIDNFDYVMAEVNDAELYEGCALFPQLSDYLHDRGFSMQTKSMTKYEWGDDFYVRTLARQEKEEKTR